MHAREIALLLCLLAFTSSAAVGSPESPDPQASPCTGRKLPSSGLCDSEALLSGELGGEHLRPVSPSLPDHYWEGEGCRVLCYCGAGELLCCPRDVFFDPSVLHFIPCDAPIQTKD